MSSGHCTLGYIWNDIYWYGWAGKELQMKKEFEISKQPDEEKKNRTVSAGYLKKE